MFLFNHFESYATLLNVYTYELVFFYFFRLVFFSNVLKTPFIGTNRVTKGYYNEFS